MLVCFKCGLKNSANASLALQTFECTAVAKLQLPWHDLADKSLTLRSCSRLLDCVSGQVCSADSAGSREYRICRCVKPLHPFCMMSLTCQVQVHLQCRSACCFHMLHKACRTYASGILLLSTCAAVAFMI